MHALKEPTHVPTKWIVWLLFTCLTLLSSAIYIGSWVQAVDSRISTAEKSRDEAEFNYRNVAEKLDSIQHRLSLIEGKLELIQRKL